MDGQKRKSLDLVLFFLSQGLSSFSHEFLGRWSNKYIDKWVQVSRVNLWPIAVWQMWKIRLVGLKSTLTVSLRFVNLVNNLKAMQQLNNSCSGNCWCLFLAMQFKCNLTLIFICWYLQIFTLIHLPLNRFREIVIMWTEHIEASMVLRKSASPNRPQPTISQSLWHVCLRMKCSWEEGRGKSFTAWEWVLPKIHVNALLIKAKWWVGSWGEICRTVEVHRSPGRHSRLPVHPRQMPVCEVPSSPKRLGRAGCETSHAVAARSSLLCQIFFLSSVFGEHDIQLNYLLVTVRAARACFEREAVTLHKFHSFLIHYSLRSFLLSCFSSESYCVFS